MENCSNNKTKMIKIVKRNPRKRYPSNQKVDANTRQKRKETKLTYKN